MGQSPRSLRHKAETLQDQEVQLWLKATQLERRNSSLLRTTLSQAITLVENEVTTRHDAITILVNGKKWTDISDTETLKKIIEHQADIVERISRFLLNARNLLSQDSPNQ